MKRLDENLGSVGFDNLINGLYPPAEVFSIVIRKENAEPVLYKRGTLLALSDADGKYVIIGGGAADTADSENGEVSTPDSETQDTEAAAEVLTANCVLAEDTEVGTEEDAVAVAYRTGHFNANVLIVADGYEITAKDKEDLRSVGILLSDAVAI